MNSKGKIWVALDTDKSKALKIARAVFHHPAVYGFKLNRLVDQEVFRRDGEPRLFAELGELGKSQWVDIKAHDVERTVAGRIEPYVASGLVNFITVHAKGEVDMMMAAVKAGEGINGLRAWIIAVTELTSLSEEQVHLGSGHPAKASVIYLARNAVLSGVKYLVCSANELEVLAKRRELILLEKFVPGITPVWKKTPPPDQKRIGTPEAALVAGASKLVIGSAIIDADDPLEAVEKTAAEIEAIEIPEK